MAPPRLKVLGNRIVTAVDDLPVRFRGVHLCKYSFGAHFELPARSATELGWVETATTAPSSGGWGANWVAFWVETQPAIGDTSDVYTQTGINQWLNHVDELQRITEENDAYLVLYWHNEHGQAGHPGVSNARARQAMANMAQRFATKDNVLFIVQSEPNGHVLGGRPCEVGTSVKVDDWDNLQKPAQLQMINAIRAQKPEAVIGLSGLWWTQRFTEMMLNPVDSANPGGMNLFVQPHSFGSWPAAISNSTNCNAAQAAAALIAGGFGIGHPGYPIVYGEFGPNPGQPLPDHAQAQTAGTFGYCGWALTDDGSPTMLSGGATDLSQLTDWGVLYKSILQANYEPLPVPGSSSPIPDPPDIEVPVPSTRLIVDNALPWNDGSYFVDHGTFGTTTVVGLADSRFVQVDFTGTPAGFQLQHPDSGRVPVNDHTHWHLLIRASPAQLTDLRLGIYPQHTGPFSAETVDLNQWVAQTSDGWSLLSIPMSYFLGFGAVAEDPFIARAELKPFAAIGAFQIADWALVGGVRAASMEWVTHPATSPEDLPLNGPPTARVRDESGAPLPGVLVNAFLVPDTVSFTSNSVTSKMTNSNGLVTFDFLVVDTPGLYRVRLRVQ